MNRSVPQQPAVLGDAKRRVPASRFAVLKAVNKELVGRYWDSGRLIAERQVDSTHGDALVEPLTRDLQTEFPSLTGFRRRNEFCMREFCLLYRDLPQVQPLVA